MELIHRNLLIGIHDALQETFFEKNKYADKVIERLLKAHKKWGSQDRAVVSEIFYNIIRWKKRLEYYMGEGVKPGNIYKLILAYLLWSKTHYKKFEEFEGIKIADILHKLKKGTVPTKAVQYSIPEWLAETLEKELGPNWEKEMDALNDPAPTVLRVNTLKTTKEELIKELLEDEIESHAIRGYEDAVELEEKKNVFLTDAFKKGMFEVQDASSQLIGKFLGVEEGMRVVDVCAGAGGKTLHLAALMKNKGQIIALDIFEWKLAELKRRAKRAGAHNIETRLIDDNKVIKRLHNSADRLLIDAPCSGLGVLKRNPDSKWKIDQAFIDRIKAEQENILQDYSKIIKKGGQMVYATCSILPSENTMQTKKFIENNPEYELIQEEKIMPSHGYDGFYMALIKRKG
ncbi:class I SAM-dependent methyltransferase [Elizabethkingia meningoseptica]|uniref:RsmB/NOP family class I SAM-dependent RNA methyltransferase n=1 Tax=Elizabethkingia meningoseptica TaxID=238 RepID=UPI0009999112|nr:methyltransferase domain-containing protein [Elizabethkingia meningoseptica]EJK5328264.1 class I SAM-dependent methyltransferase [Elizabethkingia meningoseptica]MDE5437247.1 class I SAM-dependent methyltransferase [Elizabethkingia meningoseptica]MDE5466533.1 class I SAM-dependent methyltransferase [Elizabethkingia meningoseptica]MDE5474237.1 class I SAM-dependent methyltransferase [Elizabethkingia meningoseptica]MDE5477670.1 class I SAM-dependent methyltransferase [Elizabethkingia meningose